MKDSTYTSSYTDIENNLDYDNSLYLELSNNFRDKYLRDNTFQLSIDYNIKPVDTDD